MKKLPIGIQTFRIIREEGYVYVDKTPEALELIERHKYTFLARPRRFGKSLFLDTLRNIFEGNKELFEGLYIDDRYDWDRHYPVIKISWDGKLRTVHDIEQKLNETLLDNQKRLGVVCDEDLSPTICFERIIKEAHTRYRQKVVVLIDEYDKPILDVIDDVEQAREHREYLKRLYSILKGVDEYIQFAFLTGVSKFSKASIFSGLNMLTDISLMPRFGNICGYTQRDLETTFRAHLSKADMAKVTEWYNGYNFLKDALYNPFDILQFIANDLTFKNYWFNSGTPSFLIKLIRANNYFLPTLSHLIVGEELVDTFDLDNIKPEVILFQSGYLTIEERIVEEDDLIEYRLRLPNKEVKISLSDYIINYFYGDKNPINTRRPIRQALQQSDLEAFKQTLISIFASIPYNNYTNNPMPEYEGFYASVIYVYLQSLGIDIIGEDVTNRGRIDLTLFIEGKIYILEFKVVDRVEHNALEQIRQKRYYEKYLQESRDIYLVGIEFGKEEKNIVGFAWERVESRN